VNRSSRRRQDERRLAGCAGRVSQLRCAGRRHVNYCRHYLLPKGCSMPLLTSSTQRLASIFVACLILVANPTSSRAQSNEIGGGTSWAWIQGDYARWHTYQGWSFEVGRLLTPHFGIAGEVNGNRYSDVSPNGWSESHRVFTFVGGPRLRTSASDRVIGFAHLLAGIDRTSYTIHTPPAPDFNRSFSGFLIEPGGGVDVMVTRRLAVRSRLNVGVGDPWYAISWHAPLWRVGLSAVYKW